ncbi:MAG: DUF6525 family protein [Pseudomonadota bacterium]
MPSNRGKTILKRRRRSGNAMQAFDRLPPELRIWLASAALPWRPGSVLGTYGKALARTRNTDHALQALDRIQRRLMARDARKIWGEDHPEAALDRIL